MNAQHEEGPPDLNPADLHTMFEIGLTKGEVVHTSLSGAGWAAYTANLQRMARRAAADPAYYEIAGGTVQRLADELRAETDA